VSAPSRPGWREPNRPARSHRRLPPLPPASPRSSWGGGVSPARPCPASKRWFTTGPFPLRRARRSPSARAPGLRPGRKPNRGPSARSEFTLPLCHRPVPRGASVPLATRPQAEQESRQPVWASPCLPYHRPHPGGSWGAGISPAQPDTGLHPAAVAQARTVLPPWPTVSRRAHRPRRRDACAPTASAVSGRRGVAQRDDKLGKALLDLRPSRGRGARAERWPLALATRTSEGERRWGSTAPWRLGRWLRQEQRHGRGALSSGASVGPWGLGLSSPGRQHLLLRLPDYPITAGSVRWPPSP
jgi:hypothetical protein